MILRDFQDFDASLGAGSNSLIQQQPDHFQLPSLFPTAQQPYLTAQQPDLFSTLGRRNQLQHQVLLLNLTYFYYSPYYIFYVRKKVFYLKYEYPRLRTRKKI